MNSEMQLRVQGYLDNELSPGEARKVAAMLSLDREAQELYGELHATRAAIRENEPVLKLEDSREFYWSRIERRIAAAERLPQRSATPWWLRILAPVAGTAALGALLSGVMSLNTGVVAPRGEESVAAASHPLHGEVEDLAPGMSSVMFRSEEHGVTVVWLTANE